MYTLRVQVSNGTMVSLQLKESTALPSNFTTILSGITSNGSILPVNTVCIGSTL